MRSIYKLVKKLVMAKKEHVTPDTLRLIASQLRTAADIIATAADSLDEENGDGVELGLTTAAQRVDELGGFAKNVARKTDQRLAEIRLDRAKLASRTKRNGR